MAIGIGQPEGETKLQKLAAAMPVANQKVAEQRKQAQVLQLQNATAAAPAAAPVQQQAQQAGAAVTQNQGAALIDAAKQNVQQGGQLAQQGAQVQQADISQKLNALKNQATTEQQSSVERFANMDQDAKKKIFDSRLKFAEDESGRKFLNDRQLADYAKLNAKNDQEYQSYAQAAQQAQQRSQQVMETAYKKIEQQLDIQNQLGTQERNNDLQMKLAQAKNDMKKAMASAAAQAQNRAQVYSTGGTLIGAGLGAFGGPAGAAGGAQVGGSFGALAAAQSSGQSNVNNKQYDLGQG